MNSIFLTSNLSKISVIVLVLLLTLSIVTAEEEPDIKIDYLSIQFVHTFSDDSPISEEKPVARLGEPGGLEKPPPFSGHFRFNSTYKESIISHFTELNESGELLEFEDSENSIHYIYKNFSDYRFYIYPSHILVRLISDTETAKGEYRDTYGRMISYVHNNVRDNIQGIKGFCFKSPPGARTTVFCPMLKQNRDFQRSSWTILVQFKELSPQINETNKVFFRDFHKFDYPNGVKVVRPLITGEYYIFYDLGEDEPIIVDINPKRPRGVLIDYLVLTELIYAKAEQKKTFLRDQIRDLNTQVERHRDTIYASNNEKTVGMAISNLSKINLSKSSETLRELTWLNTVEENLLQRTQEAKQNDPYFLIYEEKIKSHHDFFSRDVEKLKSDHEKLRSDRNEAIRVGDSKLQSLKQIKMGYIGIGLAFIMGLVSTIVSIKSLKNQTSTFKDPIEKMEELTNRQIHSFRKDINNVLKKMDSLFKRYKK